MTPEAGSLKPRRKREPASPQNTDRGSPPEQHNEATTGGPDIIRWLLDCKHSAATTWYSLNRCKYKFICWASNSLAIGSYMREWPEASVVAASGLSANPSHPPCYACQLYPSIPPRPPKVSLILNWRMVSDLPSATYPGSWDVPA